MSKGKKAMQPAYEAAKRKRLRDHPECEVPGCVRPSTDPHHHLKVRRNGKGLLAFRYVCSVHHHEFHHVNPNEARANGFLDCSTDADWAKPGG